jgi:hypothetical protein
MFNENFVVRVVRPTEAYFANFLLLGQIDKKPKMFIVHSRLILVIRNYRERKIGGVKGIVEQALIIAARNLLRHAALLSL